MGLFALILRDLRLKIEDHIAKPMTEDQFNSQEDAYLAGVAAATEGAEEYLREIFPEK